MGRIDTRYRTVFTGPRGWFGLCECEVENIELNQTVNEGLRMVILWLVWAGWSSPEIDPATGPGYIGVYAKSVFKFPIPVIWSGVVRRLGIKAE